MEQYERDKAGVNVHSINRSIADIEQDGKAGGRLYSKIPSIFDRAARNSSTIESNSYQATTVCSDWQGKRSESWNGAVLHRGHDLFLFPQHQLL